MNSHFSPTKIKPMKYFLAYKLHIVIQLYGNIYKILLAEGNKNVHKHFIF